MKRKSRRQFAEHGGQARVLAFVAWRVMRPLLWLILSLGYPLWVPIQSFALGKALSPAILSAGYSPTSMNMGNLPQSQAVHHDKNFIMNLKAETPGLRVCERRELPEQSGNQHRLYMYSPLGSNVAQSSDGVVGSPITISVVNTTATIGQFTDYINTSDISMQTAIDPMLENIQRELAYRLGRTITQIVLNTADGANAVDAKVAGNTKAYNVPFGKSDITTNVQSLAGQNVMPFDKGRYVGLIHPFIIGDTLNDSANNSLTDVLKHTVEGQMKLEELPEDGGAGDTAPVVTWAGCQFYPTTMVTQTANYQSQTGLTALRTYIVGKDAVIAISLGKKEQAQVGDGDWRNMRIWMNRWTEPSPSDPARVIGGNTSYNVKFVATLPPDPTMRLRYVDAVSNVS